MINSRDKSRALFILLVIMLLLAALSLFWVTPVISVMTQSALMRACLMLLAIIFCMTCIAVSLIGAGVLSGIAALVTLDAGKCTVFINKLKALMDELCSRPCASAVAGLTVMRIAEVHMIRSCLIISLMTCIAVVACCSCVFAGIAALMA